MAIRIPPPPTNTKDQSIWNNWYISIQNAISHLAGSFKWTLLDFTGSNLTNILTKSHQVLDNLQGGSLTERYHLTSAQATAVAAFDTTKWTDLTDAGDSTLHYHATDRARANHSGTQLLATISDAGTAASQSGLTVVVNTAKLTAGGVDGSMTFTNGVLTAQTQAT